MSRQSLMSRAICISMSTKRSFAEVWVLENISVNVHDVAVELCEILNLW